MTRGATQRAKIRTRAMVNKDFDKKQQQRKKLGIVSSDENSKKSSISLNEAKKKAREKNQRSPAADDDILVKDIYQNVCIYLTLIDIEQCCNTYIFLK